MTVVDLLPWLNITLVPATAMLVRISGQLATLTAVQQEHARRLETLERRTSSWAALGPR